MFLFFSDENLALEYVLPLEKNSFGFAAADFIFCEMISRRKKAEEEDLFAFFPFSLFPVST